MSQAKIGKPDLYPMTKKIKEVSLFFPTNQFSLKHQLEWGESKCKVMEIGARVPIQPSGHIAIHVELTPKPR